REICICMLSLSFNLLVSLLIAFLIVSSLFSLILRRPPGSPLFPYTTLFRSDVSIASAQPGAGAIARVSSLEPLFPKEQRLERGQDRKSTRLNSSHQIISYAVFCLKKKKKLRTKIVKKIKLTISNSILSSEDA